MNVSDNLLRLYRKEQFHPGLLAMLINPFYFARKGLAREIASLGHHVTGRTLDVGCGRKPYASDVRASEYVGLEVDTPGNRECKNADCFYDGHRFPFDDASFDSVICNQVFEHVFNPDEFLLEVARVLKPGGHFLLTVPFIWDEHEQPVDFARYTSFGLATMLGRRGFEIFEHRKSVADIRVVFQLVNAYLYKKTRTRSAIANLFFAIALMAPVNFAGALAGLVLPRNDDLYLDNVILARKAGGG